MQASTTQLVSLATYGNAFLRRIAGAPGLSKEHSALSSCEYVRFVDLERVDGAGNDGVVAADPDAWYGWLRARGTVALRLVFRANEQKPAGGIDVAERMRSGRAGWSGLQRLEAIRPDGSDIWQGRWERGDGARADSRTWRVTFDRVGRGLPTMARDSIDVTTLRSTLDQHLAVVAELARRHRLESFANAFDGGRLALASTRPWQESLGDLAPAGVLPLSAMQLLTAAQRAWVFGGTGSWNAVQLGGGDEDRYEHLSEVLYQLLVRSIEVATNASAQSD